MHADSPPYVLHAPPTSFFSIWSPDWHLVSSEDYEPVQYVVFSTPLSPIPSYIKTSFSAPYSRTPSACVPPSMRETKIHTHTKQHSFILQSVLHVHSLFRSVFSTQCDLVLRLSIYCILSFPWVHLIAAYAFFLVFPSLPSMMCFRRQFLHKVWPIRLAFLLFIVCATIFSSLNLCKASFFSHDQSNWFFSILLQHHISKFKQAKL